VAVRLDGANTDRPSEEGIMKTRIRCLAFAIAVTLSVGQVGGAAAQTQGRIERIQFAQGATSKTISGEIKGYDYVDYRIHAGAGQVMQVELKAGNPQNYFNINPPGTDTSMFIGSMTGNDFNAVLPSDGDYTIRVYLMRAAARRDEVSRYSLTVSVSGTALAPVSPTKDALIRGTPFHASAPVTCRQSADQKPRQCEAFVIRRSFDGSGTVEVRWADGGKRRILFVRGKPVSTDSPDPVSSEHRGETSVVKVGTKEQIEIPDALLLGG